jgi:hypothetical protein
MLQDVFHFEFDSTQATPESIVNLSGDSLSLFLLGGKNS